jgi:hypothetical protein
MHFQVRLNIKMQIAMAILQTWSVLIFMFITSDTVYL